MEERTVQKIIKSDFFFPKLPRCVVFVHSMKEDFSGVIQSPLPPMATVNLKKKKSYGHFNVLVVTLHGEQQRAATSFYHMSRHYLKCSVC